ARRPRSRWTTRARRPRHSDVPQVLIGGVLSWRSVADWAKRREVVLRLADRLGRGRGRLRWMDRLGDIPPAPAVPSFDRWEDHNLAATWIGHATVLLRMEGMTILTDPVFS